MIKRLIDIELETVAQIIRDNIFVPTYSRKSTVFLCGASITDKSTGRYKMAELLKNNARYELLFPEDLFDDLMAGQGQHSLLSLENILADSVDSIILFPESPGSFAELGAFANSKKLANKLICVGQKKYEKKKSFINYGPIRLIKASKTGRVFNIVYNDLDLEIEKNSFYKIINNAVTKIKKTNPTKKDIANILETENFVLPCIYLIDQITTLELYKLVEYATGQNKQIAEIATKSSISKLIKKHHITKTNTGYTITKQGVNRTKSSLKTVNLDDVRIEIINSQYRKNTIVKAVNF
jgi:hypothetical protein